MVTRCRSILSRSRSGTYTGGNGNASTRALDPAVAASAADLAGVGEGTERVGDKLIADAKLFAKGSGGERPGGAGDQSEDAAGGGVVLLISLGSQNQRVLSRWPPRPLIRGGRRTRRSAVRRVQPAGPPVSRCLGASVPLYGRTEACAASPAARRSTCP